MVWSSSGGVVKFVVPIILEFIDWIEIYLRRRLACVLHRSQRNFEKLTKTSPRADVRHEVLLWQHVLGVSR
ncbi:hypothetical protein ASG35_03960 [Burkholderia sp. Leaf177]|nr:hypothetical protein ASG35_03960 [Burkholderia sp. Leaf177]